MSKRRRPRIWIILSILVVALGVAVLVYKYVDTSLTRIVALPSPVEESLAQLEQVVGGLQLTPDSTMIYKGKVPERIENSNQIDTNAEEIFEILHSLPDSIRTVFTEALEETTLAEFIAAVLASLTATIIFQLGLVLFRRSP